MLSGVISYPATGSRGRGLVFLACLLLLLGVTGCVGLGPQAISATRTDYNQTLLETDDEQLLLNLVRLRYLDRLLFLEASALTTQFSFGASAGAAYGYQSLARENSIIDGRILVEEKPTISYTPLQGKDFVERVLSRISLETLVLLSGSGWSVDRVYRVCVERMNDIDHAERADGPTPDTEPEYEEFLRITTLLSELRDEDMYAGARSPEESSSVLRFQQEAGEISEFQELAQLLGLNPQRRVFSMSNSLDRRDGTTLNIRTRSFQGVMYFLANAVRVPEEDIEAGRVTVTRDDEGNVFDWSAVMGGLMDIPSSEDPPDNASVAVRHRGHWFYIDDSDLDSKSTFAMLGQIYALQSGSVSVAPPLLTLPVGD